MVTLMGLNKSVVLIYSIRWIYRRIWSWKVLNILFIHSLTS